MALHERLKMYVKTQHISGVLFCLLFVLARRERSKTRETDNRRLCRVFVSKKAKTQQSHRLSCCLSFVCPGEKVKGRRQENTRQWRSVIPCFRPFAPTSEETKTQQIAILSLYTKTRHVTNQPP